MAIAAVQGNNASSSAGNLTSLSIAWPNATTPNNYLVAVLSFTENPGAITKPTGTAWVQRGSNQSNGTASYVAVFECINAASQSTTSQSWTWAGAVFSAGVAIEEYSGVLTSSPADGTDAYNTGTSGGTITGGSVTTTQSGDLVLGVATQSSTANSTGITWTQSGSWVLRQQSHSNNAGNPSVIRGGILEQVVGGAASYTATTSTGSSDAWCCGTIALKAANPPTVLDDGSDEGIHYTVITTYYPGWGWPSGYPCQRF